MPAILKLVGFPVLLALLTIPEQPLRRTTTAIARTASHVPCRPPFLTFRSDTSVRSRASTCPTLICTFSPQLLYLGESTTNRVLVILVSGSKKVQLVILASGPVLYPSRRRPLFQQSTFGRRAFPERNLRIVKTLGKMDIQLIPGG